MIIGRPFTYHITVFNQLLQTEEWSSSPASLPKNFFFLSPKVCQHFELVCVYCPGRDLFNKFNFLKKDNSSIKVLIECQC